MVERRCLACGYRGKCDIEYYQEVTVCPICKGAFIDMYKLGATSQEVKANMQQLTDGAKRLGSTTVFSASQAAEGMEKLASQECEHKYRLMNSKTTKIQSTNRQKSIRIFGSFYCEKCLDIQFIQKSDDGM